MRNLLFFALFSTLVFSCKEEIQNEDQELVFTKKEAPDDTNDQASTVATADIIYKISKGDNNEFASILVSNNVSELRLNGQTYSIKTKGVKRQYFNKSTDNLVAEVKIKEDAFKVYTPELGLVIKAKIKEDKIEVSNNEEMTNSLKIKNYRDKIKLKSDTSTIAEAEWLEKDKKAILTHSSEQLWITGPMISSGFAAMALTDHAPVVRLVFMNELIMRKL